MNIRSHLTAWMKAEIQPVDIRRIRLFTSGQSSLVYRLPSAALLVVDEGHGLVELDDSLYRVERSFVVHGHKGTVLTINANSEMLSFYLILYKVRLADRSELFQHNYVWHAPAVLRLQRIVQDMYQQWMLSTLGGRLQAKGLLYQLAGEMLSQADYDDGATDLLTQAMEWIHRRYADDLSVDRLAQLLHCSTSYLTRLFRRKLSMSTLEYVTFIRLKHAKRLLLDTDWSVRRIAAEVGYRDEYYFSRLFKKKTCYSPVQYREQNDKSIVQKYPLDRSDLSIVPSYGKLYDLSENDYHIQEGDLTMRNAMRPYVWSALFLAALFMVSACSASSDPINSKQQLQNEAGNNAASNANHANGIHPSTGVKEIEHLMGTTEIPLNPERIAIYDLEDIALALDISISVASVPTGHYLYDELKQHGSEIIEMVDENINYEALLGANPDLIIASDLTVYEEEVYQNLSKIAPTIVYERGVWQQSILELGKALDLEQQASEVVVRFEQKLEQAKAVIEQAGAHQQTVAAIRPSAKDVQIFYPWFIYTDLLYNHLGLQLAPKISQLMEDKEEGTWGEIASLEVFPELTADYLFIIAGASYATEEQYQEALRALEEVEQLEIWQQHEAVRNNQVHIVSARHWMLNGPTADSMKIDDIVAIVTGGQQ